MSKNNTYSFNNNRDYSEYIETIKSIVKQNEADNKRIENLNSNTLVEESQLQSYVQNLRHIQEVQHREYELWQQRALAFSRQQKHLELLIENQSKNLAISKTQLEHGLRMINLMPNSKAEDYLANTNIDKSANENLRNDWEKVGDQMASSFFKNIEIQK